MYSIYGNVIRHETTLHDLRHRVETLQNQKLLHEAEITGQIDAVVQDATELPESDVELLNTEPKPIQESQEEPSLMSSSTNAA